MTWTQQLITPEQAAGLVRSGQRIFLTGNCATPQVFMQALLSRYHELYQVEVVQILDLSPGYITPAIADHIRINSMFLGANVRAAVNNGFADFTPVFLSEIPALFKTGRLVLDLAVIQVSPPDEHGYCSYGVEVSITKAAAESAGLVIAEVNPNMPRTLGDSFIHISQIQHFIPVDYPLPEVQPAPASPVQNRIANHIAEYIPDAATLQTGIGGIPDAVLRHLTQHKNLGIHSELFSDGVMTLIEAGVITGARKSLHHGKVVAGLVLGTQQLYNFIHDNPVVELRPTDYVNDPFIIAQNDRMVSINSALEVDLTGQVCADSIGSRFYSGVGGQVDFVRGAARSKGGMSFIALPATARHGTLSRIVPVLKPGAGVTTSRHGRTLNERVHALVGIAHPDFREDLLRYAHEQHYIGRAYPLS
jgi:4-hydroxybutyrate CoA-transferase